MEEKNTAVTKTVAFNTRELAEAFPERPRIEIAVKWLMFTATLVLLGLMSSLYPLWANLFIIVIPSILVLLFAKPVLFEKMKLITLVSMRLFTVFAFFFVEIRQFYVDLILLALIVNILEATFTDAFRHKKYFNAVSGLFLALGVIGLKGSWVNPMVSGTEALGAASFYLVQGSSLAATICYAIGYTIWNWIFVTDEFSPAVSLMHVGFLLSPIIGCVVAIACGVPAHLCMGLWLLLRASTLSIGGWLQIGAKGWFERQYHNDKFEKFIKFIHSTPMQIICMLACIGLMLAVIIIAAVNGDIGYTPCAWDGTQRELITF